MEPKILIRKASLYDSGKIEGPQMFWADKSIPRFFKFFGSPTKAKIGPSSSITYIW
jgi:hypothetical protein